jgi:ATP-dependent DNA helicase RecG
MRVRQICKDYGVIEPQFSEVSNGFMVILYKESSSKDINTNNEVIDNDNDTDNDAIDTNNDTIDTNKDTNKITIIQTKIIQEIKKNNKITISELSVIVDINLRNTKKNIIKLKNTNHLKRIGSNKGGYWQVVE